MSETRFVKRFFVNNGLVLLMFGLFLVFLVGVSVTGFAFNNQQLQAHHQPLVGFGEYLGSGEFIEAVFENWESEFLQMAALVVATIFLYQKGAADSKKLRGKEPVDTSSRYSIIHATSWRGRKKAAGKILYTHSLSLALVTLFAFSFVLHGMGGAAAYNEEARLHHEATLSVFEYVGTSQFWFESLQNWQSEFLAVGVLLLLSVYLRERHSPESKPVPESNQKTGR